VSDEQTAVLREILKWVRLAGIKELKETLASTLDTDELKRLYHFSNGTKGTIELGKLVGMSPSKVSNTWQTWLKQGLGDAVSVKGGNRFRRTFDIEDFGLKVPEDHPAPAVVGPEAEAPQQAAEP
jgi:hypothetical protein